jgi:pre-mRNA 3'-end-processing factor FIP1
MQSLSFVFLSQDPSAMGQVMYTGMDSAVAPVPTGRGGAPPVYGRGRPAAPGLRGRGGGYPGRGRGRGGMYPGGDVGAFNWNPLNLLRD